MLDVAVVDLHDYAVDVVREGLAARLPGGDLRHDVVDGHLLPTGEGVLRVAPPAAQIAPREPHEGARAAGVGGLALDAVEDLGDAHLLQVLGLRSSVLVGC